MVGLTAVESSMIAAAGYDEKMKVFYILYNNGRTYEYYDVPLEVYTGLMAAESKGKYLNDRVIDIYRYDRFQGWKQSVPSGQSLARRLGPEGLCHWSFHKTISE